MFGKAGRAETSTDPAPFSMMETTVQLKPQDQWRKVKKDYSLSAGVAAPRWREMFGAERPMTYDELVADMDREDAVPGRAERLDHADPGADRHAQHRHPHAGRASRSSGADLSTIQELGTQIEDDPEGGAGDPQRSMPSGWREGILPTSTIQRDEIARYGLTVGDVQDVIQTALGGMNITRTVEGRERYPVNLRYPRELRDDVEKIKRILVPVRLDGAGRHGQGGRPRGPAGWPSAARPARRHPPDHRAGHDPGRGRDARRVCLRRRRPAETSAATSRRPNG